MSQIDDHEEFDEEDRGPSRSQQRRDALAIFELAERLVALSEPQVKKVPMDDALRAAVQHTRRITQHIAKKRETQYLAKLLRRDDEAVAAIRAHLDIDRDAQRRENARLHRLEHLRDRLVNEDEAFAEALEQFPDADRQQLRQLIRKARDERAAERPPAAYREIFKLLRKLDEAQRKTAGDASDSDDAEPEDEPT
jgi:ribosome-associated protein